jgi:hypothetical protein
MPQFLRSKAQMSNRAVTFSAGRDSLHSVAVFDQWSGFQPQSLEARGLAYTVLESVAGTIGHRFTHIREASDHLKSVASLFP